MERDTAYYDTLVALLRRAAEDDIDVRADVAAARKTDIGRAKNTVELSTEALLNFVGRMREIAGGSQPNDDDVEMAEDVFTARPRTQELNPLRIQFAKRWTQLLAVRNQEAQNAQTEREAETERLRVAEAEATAVIAFCRALVDEQTQDASGQYEARGRRLANLARAINTLSVARNRVPYDALKAQLTTEHVAMYAMLTDAAAADSDPTCNDANARDLAAFLQHANTRIVYATSRTDEITAYGVTAERLVQQLFTTLGRCFKDVVAGDNTLISVTLLATWLLPPATDPPHVNRLLTQIAAVHDLTRLRSLFETSQTPNWLSAFLLRAFITAKFSNDRVMHNIADVSVALSTPAGMIWAHAYDNAERELDRIIAFCSETHPKPRGGFYVEEDIRNVIKLKAAWDCFACVPAKGDVGKYLHKKLATFHGDQLGTQPDGDGAASPLPPLPLTVEASIVLGYLLPLPDAVPAVAVAGKRRSQEQRAQLLPAAGGLSPSLFPSQEQQQEQPQMEIEDASESENGSQPFINPVPAALPVVDDDFVFELPLIPSTITDSFMLRDMVLGDRHITLMATYLASLVNAPPDNHTSTMQELVKFAAWCIKRVVDAAKLDPWAAKVYDRLSEPTAPVITDMDCLVADRNSPVDIIEAWAWAEWYVRIKPTSVPNRSVAKWVPPPPKDDGAWLLYELLRTPEADLYRQVLSIAKVVLDKEFEVLEYARSAKEREEAIDKDEVRLAVVGAFLIVMKNPMVARHVLSMAVVGDDTNDDALWDASRQYIKLTAAIEKFAQLTARLDKNNGNAAARFLAHSECAERGFLGLVPQVLFFWTDDVRSASDRVANAVAYANRDPADFHGMQARIALAGAHAALAAPRAASKEERALLLRRLHARADRSVAYVSEFASDAITETAARILVDGAACSFLWATHVTEDDDMEFVGDPEPVDASAMVEKVMRMLVRDGNGERWFQRYYVSGADDNALNILARAVHEILQGRREITTAFVEDFFGAAPIPPQPQQQPQQQQQQLAMGEEEGVAAQREELSQALASPPVSHPQIIDNIIETSQMAIDAASAAVRLQPQQQLLQQLLVPVVDEEVRLLEQLTAAVPDVLADPAAEMSFVPAAMWRALDAIEEAERSARNTKAFRVLGTSCGVPSMRFVLTAMLALRITRSVLADPTRYDWWNSGGGDSFRVHHLDMYHVQFPKFLRSATDAVPRAFVAKMKPFLERLTRDLRAMGPAITAHRKKHPQKARVVSEELAAWLQGMTQERRINATIEMVHMYKAFGCRSLAQLVPLGMPVEFYEGAPSFAEYVVPERTSGAPVFFPPDNGPAGMKRARETEEEAAAATAAAETDAPSAKKARVEEAPRVPPSSSPSIPSSSLSPSSLPEFDSVAAADFSLDGEEEEEEEEENEEVRRIRVMLSDDGAGNAGGIVMNTNLRNLCGFLSTPRTREALELIYPRLPEFLLWLVTVYVIQKITGAALAKTKPYTEWIRKEGNAARFQLHDLQTYIAQTKDAMAALAAQMATTEGDALLLLQFLYKRLGALLLGSPGSKTALEIIQRAVRTSPQLSPTFTAADFETAFINDGYDGILTVYRDWKDFWLWRKDAYAPFVADLATRIDANRIAAAADGGGGGGGGGGMKKKTNKKTSGVVYDAKKATFEPMSEALGPDEEDTALNAAHARLLDVYMARMTTFSADKDWATEAGKPPRYGHIVPPMLRGTIIEYALYQYEKRQAARKEALYQAPLGAEKSDSGTLAQRWRRLFDQEGKDMDQALPVHHAVVRPGLVALSLGDVNHHKLIDLLVDCLFRSAATQLFPVAQFKAHLRDPKSGFDDGVLLHCVMQVHDSIRNMPKEFASVVKLLKADAKAFYDFLATQLKPETRALVIEEMGAYVTGANRAAWARPLAYERKDVRVYVPAAAADMTEGDVSVPSQPSQEQTGNVFTDTVALWNAKHRRETFLYETLGSLARILARRGHSPLTPEDTAPYAYQLSAIHAILQREEHVHEAAYTAKRLMTGRTFTPVRAEGAPAIVRGMQLSFKPGLGKTRTALLAAVAGNKAHRSRVSAMSNPELETAAAEDVTHATLVVMPTQLIPEWIAEVRNVFASGKVRWYALGTDETYGQNADDYTMARLAVSEKFRDNSKTLRRDLLLAARTCDFVFVGDKRLYNSLRFTNFDPSAHSNKQLRTALDTSGKTIWALRVLATLRWQRLIIDESHISATARANAYSKFRAEYRLLLTGTPQNDNSGAGLEAQLRILKGVKKPKATGSRKVATGNVIKEIAVDRMAEIRPHQLMLSYGPLTVDLIPYDRRTEPHELTDNEHFLYNILVLNMCCVNHYERSALLWASDLLADSADGTDPAVSVSLRDLLAHMKILGQLTTEERAARNAKNRTKREQQREDEAEAARQLALDSGLPPPPTKPSRNRNSSKKKKQAAAAAAAKDNEEGEEGEGEEGENGRDGNDADDSEATGKAGYVSGARLLVEECISVPARVNKGYDWKIGDPPLSPAFNVLLDFVLAHGKEALGGRDLSESMVWRISRANRAETFAWLNTAAGTIHSSRMGALTKVMSLHATEDRAKMAVFHRSILTGSEAVRAIAAQLEQTAKQDTYVGNTRNGVESIVAVFKEPMSLMRHIVTTFAAGAVGLNLQDVADGIVFLERSYEPMEETQAIARAYRTGQKRQVIVYDIEANLPPGKKYDQPTQLPNVLRRKGEIHVQKTALATGLEQTGTAGEALATTTSTTIVTESDKRVDVFKSLFVEIEAAFARDPSVFDHPNDYAMDLS